MPVLVGAVLLCLSLNASLESLLFGADYKSWLANTFGLRYDQRNALVVGFAMGFAIIPIIFSISEEALSNVPRNLIAGSLALGATPWQTLARLVFISASPGIFSALMIGFGRAVGETMIVLMATGNTPIMDWSLFNGFRTLSANIAVEIPEAPHGGTLYRTLFMAALLLFAITFLVNTGAEIIRQRLRKKYSQF
jgi:phosphate transport system permease protein